MRTARNVSKRGYDEKMDRYKINAYVSPEIFGKLEQIRVNRSRRTQEQTVTGAIVDAIEFLYDEKFAGGIES